MFEFYLFVAFVVIVIAFCAWWCYPREYMPGATHPGVLYQLRRDADRAENRRILEETRARTRRMHEQTARLNSAVLAYTISTLDLKLRESGINHRREERPIVDTLSLMDGAEN